MIEGALKYCEIEEFEGGVAALLSITPLLEGDELLAHRAAVEDIQSTLNRAKEIQANCRHEGYYWSDSLVLTCGHCGALLWRPRLR